MTTLVTGATGGLGRTAAESLHARGARVRATGRDPARARPLREAGIEFHECDLALADEAALGALLQDVDTVWHCAALSSPWGRLNDFTAANVLATRRLARGAVERGVRRFVHVSTPSIYFDWRHRRGVQESFRPSRFANHYALTKALAEEEIGQLATRHPETTFVILRPRGLFGPHDRVLLPRVLDLLRARHGALSLPRAGQATIDLTFLPNAVHALDCATVASGVRSGAAFNITNHEPATLASLLEGLLRRELGLDYRIRSLPYPALDALARVMTTASALTGREPALTRYSAGVLNFDMTLDNAAARRELGYLPIHDLAEGIHRTGAWLRRHGTNHGF